jgi:hypothetical protein
MSATEKRIKCIVAPSGDWFRIQIEHVSGEEDHIVMSRVCAWAVVSDELSSPGIEDSIEGIDSCGYGHTDDYLNYFYVYGEDIAPNGKSWRTVFNETPSFNWGLKEIADLARPTDSK